MQLSKSAPTQAQSFLLDRALWSRREPRQHISSVCSVGGDSVAEDVNEVLGGLTGKDLQDIESEDEEADEAVAEGMAGVGLGGGSGLGGSQQSMESDDSDDSDDEEGEHVGTPSSGGAVLPGEDQREEGGGKIRSRAGSSASGIRPRAGMERISLIFLENQIAGNRGSQQARFALGSEESGYFGKGAI